MGCHQLRRAPACDFMALIDIYFQINKEKVVWGIQHHLKLLSHYNDLEILEACGRLDTNCFELRVTGYFS